MFFKSNKSYNRITELTRDKMQPSVLDNNIHLNSEQTRNNRAFRLSREPSRSNISKLDRTRTSKKQIPKLDEKFICKFDPNDKHLYKNNARILPCNNIACTDCIKKFMDSNTGILKCNLCTKDHRISNIKYLQVDPHMVITMVILLVSTKKFFLPSSQKYFNFKWKY